MGCVFLKVRYSWSPRSHTRTPGSASASSARQDTVRTPYDTTSGRDCVKSLWLCLHGTRPQMRAATPKRQPQYQPHRHVSRLRGQPPGTPTEYRQTAVEQNRNKSHSQGQISALALRGRISENLSSGSLFARKRSSQHTACRARSFHSGPE